MPSEKTSDSRRPVVGIMADSIEIYGHRGYSVLHGYVRAITTISRALPVMLPSSAEALDVATLLATLDGIVLTGSPSNVAAERYSALPLPESTRQDPSRDAAVLDVLPHLIERGMPVLGICRGLQELNVMYGGTLETAVHAQRGRFDHREGDHDRPIERWYDDSHDIEIRAGGVLQKLAGTLGAQVNSLHHQGVERLGQGLRTEAVAPDGLIEAFSISVVPQFTLAVQWHPEMRIDDSPLSRSIFEGFGSACREHLRERESERALRA